MEEKYMKRFHSFQQSLYSLEEAKRRDMKDSFVLSGTAAKFSITFELAWKIMKDILIQRCAIINFVTGSPKEVLKQAFQAELITDQKWMEMLKVRNELSYDYDGMVIKEYCKVITDVYIDIFFQFERAVVELES